MNNQIISQDVMTALLGRPLSDVEKANYDIYLQIAVLRIEDLLCIDLGDKSEFPIIPMDLQLVIARCFAAVTLEQKDVANHGITNKKVEDFSISYDKDVKSPMVVFVEQNSATLDKYSQCQGPIRSGKVCCGNCF